MKIIDENLTIITKKMQSILWNKPTIIGASILELSKLFMLDFHYNVMKKQTECSLLYSDTDSFVYKVKTNSFYDDLTKNSTLKKHFDISNFPSDHKLYDKTKAKVVLKFKDELQEHQLKNSVPLSLNFTRLLLVMVKTKCRRKELKNSRKPN